MNTNLVYGLRTSCLDNEEFFKYQKSINILMHTYSISSYSLPQINN